MPRTVASLMALASCLAVLPACGGGGASPQGGSGGGSGGDGAAGGDAATDGGPGSAENARRLESCGLKGEYVINQATPSATCDGVPHTGDSIVVELGSDGDARVRVGAYTIPIDVSADCVISADSCVTTIDADTGLDIYSRVTVRIARLGNGVEAVFDSSVIDNHQAQTCTGRTMLTASPRRSCEPVGRYTAATAASITSGACGYGWPAGEIAIEPAPGDRYSVSWAGETFEPVPLDAGACALAPTLGVQGLLVFNGAPRVVRMTVNVTASGLDGTIDDRLTGTSDFGETCGATFHFSAGRAGLGGGTALPRGCATPPPFICGDGTCDTAHGEGCYPCRQDCPCAAGLQCSGRFGEPGQCLQPCNVWTDQCPDGQRCDIPDGTGYYASDSQAYCGPAGTVTAGSRCAKDADCARGLQCLKEINFLGGFGLCLPRCNPNRSVAAATACITPDLCIGDPRSSTGYLGGCNHTCDPRVAGSCGGTDAFCWMRYTNAAAHCAPQPPGGLSDIGGPCPDPATFDSRPQCKPGLQCVGFTCSATACAVSVCTTTCTTAATCPPALPTCRIDHCGPAM